MEAKKAPYSISAKIQNSDRGDFQTTPKRSIAGSRPTSGPARAGCAPSGRHLDVVSGVEREDIQMSRQGSCGGQLEAIQKSSRESNVCQAGAR